MQTESIQLSVVCLTGKENACKGKISQGHRVRRRNLPAWSIRQEGIFDCSNRHSLPESQKGTERERNKAGSSLFYQRFVLLTSDFGFKS